MVNRNDNNESFILNYIAIILFNESLIGYLLFYSDSIY